MIDTKELRRLAQEATPGPWYIGSGIYEGRNIYSVEAVTDDEGFTYNPVVATAEDDEVACWDANARLIAAANPAVISELLDRLEAAEADALEQARLNGMGSEREAALMAKLEAAEKERDALRAKIEAMERQEPVRHEFQGRDGAWYPFINQRHYENTVADGTWPIRALYALPGAQPAWSSQAVLDITAERRRQIEVERWTPEHDDEHRAGEMAKAAACYALVSAGFNPDAAGSMWPWRRRWWKPSDKRRDLIKAGALILAEVERLDRTAKIGRGPSVRSTPSPAQKENEHG